MSIQLCFQDNLLETEVGRQLTQEREAKHALEQQLKALNTRLAQQESEVIHWQEAYAHKQVAFENVMDKLNELEFQLSNKTTKPNQKTAGPNKRGSRFWTSSS